MSETPFNYDLERMKKCVESPRYRKPVGLTFEEYEVWCKTVEKRIVPKDITTVEEFNKWLTRED